MISPISNVPSSNNTHNKKEEHSNDKKKDNSTKLGKVFSEYLEDAINTYNEYN